MLVLFVVICCASANVERTRRDQTFVNGNDFTPIFYKPIADEYPIKKTEQETLVEYVYSSHEPSSQSQVPSETLKTVQKPSDHLQKPFPKYGQRLPYNLNNIGGNELKAPVKPPSRRRNRHRKNPPSLIQSPSKDKTLSAVGQLGQGALTIGSNVFGLLPAASSLGLGLIVGLSAIFAGTRSISVSSNTTSPNLFPISNKFGKRRKRTIGLQRPNW